MSAQENPTQQNTAEPAVEEVQRPRLKEQYLSEIAPALMRRFGYSNMMEAPRLSKIVVSMGVGVATQDSKALDAAMQDLATVTGQRPVIRRARRSIAQFKVRQGNPVGCVVTLRRDRMYEFLDRLISIALPRIRDFRGLPTEAVDGRGNYNLGLREQTVFPEIDLDNVARVQGMDIAIVTTATSGRPSAAAREVHALARKALIVRSRRTPKFRVRQYNRCRLCGRPRAYIRRFGMCRICFREMAQRGLLPGITKSSW
jgi:large subunit ribosomal protein L5